MADAPFVLFIGLGCIWAVVAAGGVILLFKADGQKIRFGKWGLLVALPIVVPLVAALVFSAVVLQRSS